MTEPQPVTMAPLRGGPTEQPVGGAAEPVLGRSDAGPGPISRAADRPPHADDRRVDGVGALLAPQRERLESALPHGAEEVPGLAAALVAAQAIDRAVAHLVASLLDLDEHQLAETITGVPLEQWLAIVGRRTRSDRRMLLTTCDVLRRLPTLRGAFLDEGSVSWAQTRAIVLAVERLPHHLDARIDAALADRIPACRQDDPDSLVGVVMQALRSIEATSSSAASDPPQPEQEFLALQPRLDGTGGRIHGELGALGFATVDAALTPTPQELRGEAGPIGGAAARARARRLVGLCDASLDGHEAPGEAGTSSTLGEDPAPGEDRDDGPRGSRPQLLVRIELATLLEGRTVPAELLTHLTGGKLWVDAATVRQLVEHRGADLRSVVLDDTGRVVGVGHRTRVPPGWLRDAALALHDTCTAPGCLRPARTSDLDHAHPWIPHEPGTPGGATDVDQLAPLCRSHNRTKERAGWYVDRSADGVSRWRHPATGIETTTRPATWYPATGRTDEPVPGDHVTGVSVARERRPRWDASRADPAAGVSVARERRPRWDASRSPPARRATTEGRSPWLTRFVTIRTVRRCGCGSSPVPPAPPSRGASATP